MDGPHMDSTSDTNSGRGGSEKQLLNHFEYIVPGRPIMSRYLVEYPPTESSMLEVAESLCIGLDQSRASVFIRHIGDKNFDRFEFEFLTTVETVSVKRFPKTEYSL